MYKLRRRLFSQNFLYNQQLVSNLVGNSSIGKKDLVVEIGPGKGIITSELIKRAGHVIAVELDSNLYLYLQTKLKHPNLTLHQGDFLNFDLPKLSYKVFANIPFAIESKVIHKLLNDGNPPQDCYLVTMDKLAYRLANNKKMSMFAAMYLPWFEFSVVYKFKAYDFLPPPKVGTVLFRFKIKERPLLPINERRKYQRFIKWSFGNGLSVRNNLNKRLSVNKIDQALQKLSLSRKVKPAELSFEKWLMIYRLLQGN